MQKTILGVLLAIAITATLDAVGLSEFSALPLFPLMCIFWYVQRLSRKSIGFVWARFSDYVLAILFPILVMGAVVVIASVAGALDFSHTDWQKTWINLAIFTFSTVLIAMITEEGFFRGWLFASMERASVRKSQILIWSSIAFSLWHLTTATLDTGFDLPSSQVPIFLVNAVVMGAVWGLLRLISGSVIVSSVSHGLWNGMAYVLFGFGTKLGALGIKNTAVFGPEVGILGLGLNLIFFLVLWRFWRRSLPGFKGIAGFG